MLPVNFLLPVTSEIVVGAAEHVAPTVVELHVLYEVDFWEVPVARAAAAETVADAV